MADRLTGMEVFVAAVDSGSFTAAASAMAMSPTMVGKHIRALEDRLGARLLVRTTRTQSLTEVGRLYLERCRQVIADVQAAEASAEALTTAPRGMLRVHSPVSLGAQVLAPAVARYLAQYPEVSVDLVLADRGIDLVEEGFDLSVQIGALADSSLVARPVGDYAMWLCASPAYLAQHGTPRAPQDLRGHDCLSFAFWSRKDTWRLIKEDAVETVPVRGRMTVNNGQALKHAAIHGGGIVMQPAMLLADAVARGELVRVLPAWQPATRPIHLLYAADRRPTPKLRTFIDFVVEALRTGGLETTAPARTKRR